MGFPIGSTSVQTSAIKRIGQVAQRMVVERWITSAGVYNCRAVSGSSTWSQHSWGNAMDIFVRGQDHDEARRIVAEAFVYQATHRTRVNRFIRLPIAQVIDHDGRRVWEPGRGWFAYDGTTGDHVHISGSPMHEGRPPCA